MTLECRPSATTRQLLTNTHEVGGLVANARHVRCHKLIERGQAKLIEGDAERVVLDLCQRAGDRALLFVDPPWEPDQDGRATDFSALFAATPAVAALVARLPMVMLKVPRAFDLRSLPPGVWRVAYELGAPETGDAQVVRMLTVARGLPEAPPAARAPRWID